LLNEKVSQSTSEILKIGRSEEEYCLAFIVFEAQYANWSGLPDDLFSNQKSQFG
jgi:hypothetical protein